ncbi:unnamed protein product [Cyclocybe aegerita]|uniref:Uncharacterized protein n=1 Tax=Cyclocybe aegerita TaxID=1973307 RepID=A0A8S0WQM0_CYCAE|nr:unnamed protein product [Cyclocybe aegerita]
MSPNSQGEFRNWYLRGVFDSSLDDVVHNDLGTPTRFLSYINQIPPQRQHSPPLPPPLPSYEPLLYTLLWRPLSPPRDMHHVPHTLFTAHVTSTAPDTPKHTLLA